MTKYKEFTISVLQYAVESTIDATYLKVESLIESAAKKGAQIICLQEMFRSPYFCTTEVTEKFSLAEEVEGESFQRFSKIAKKLSVVIVLPIFEKRALGLYHNSVVVVDADGANLGVYRKMHIPDDPLFLEKYYFSPGEAKTNSEQDHGYRVFKTKYANIGVLICWDQWYPEAARITSLLGAEVLFYPTAIGWHPKEKESFGNKQREAWMAVQRGHAISNGVYVAAANRIGFEETAGTEGLEFFGSSFICDPFGEYLEQASVDKEEILLTKCSTKVIEETRLNWPFLRDRRIDSYAPILERHLKN